MKKSIKTIGIVYMLVIAGFLGFISFEPDVVRSQITIYVDDDNTVGPWDGSIANPYQTIQDGIDNAIIGDIVYVLNGTYLENISVYKTINLTGENRDNTLIDGLGQTYTALVTANWVNITGFTFTNGTLGIQLDSSYNRIINNNMSNNDYGIRIYEFTNDNEVINNNVYSNDEYGIYIWQSSNNTVVSNNVSTKINDGIYLGYSSSNNITSNNVSNSRHGIYIDTSSSYNNITGNNISTNNENGIFIASMSNYNLINKNNCSNNSYAGIYIDFSFNNTIKENVFYNNTEGVSLYFSNNNTISNNSIILNNGNGTLIGISDNNSIYHNNFIDNAVQAYDNGTNMWNLSYPLGGNHWSDWTIPDADLDGFVDNPYLISGGSNQDNWPFSTQDGWIYEWTNKSAYPNYSPTGMPDFNQTQNPNWMAIYPGPDTILDTPVHPNDISDGINYIAPGPDNILDSLPLVNDDVAEYAYCGPTAVANCLWWFDSKFANETGIPGDGADEYPLVENYSGIVDDHFVDNVAPLIEDLANRFNTSGVGETNSSNMVEGINQLLIDRGLDLHYDVYNVSWPTFNFTAQEIKNCSDVILFLALYDDTGQRIWGHIVTSAGVNEDVKKIAISDPILDIVDPVADPLTHNDAALVSHDMYNVTIGPPFVVTAPVWAWQLDGYVSGYNISHDYAVVEEAVIITPNSLPGAPFGLAASADGTYINITWTQPTSDGGSPITNYAIYRGTTSDGEVFYKQIGNLTHFNDTDVTLDITYYYKVKAVNALGEGPFSNEAFDTPSSLYSVDYINITSSPNGSELSGGDVSVGYQEWGYCSAYNNSKGYIGRVVANWNPDGGDSSLLGPIQTDYNGIDVGSISGDVWLNASYNNLNASVNYIVLPPTVDYIEITDSIGGSPLTDKTVGVGFSEWGFCSSGNFSIGFFGYANADWSIEGGNANLQNGTTTEHNGIYVGSQGGDVWFNATNGTFNASVHYTVLTPTVDYIEITDTAKGTPLINKTVTVGFIEHANCTAFNYSIGAFGINQADWTAEGGNSSLIGSSPSYNITIEVGNATGTVWLNATYLTHFDSVNYTVIPVVDSIEITYLMNMTPIPDQDVPVGFQQWANCAAYNDSLGFVGNVTVDWAVEGELASPLGSTPDLSNGIDVGISPGKAWLNVTLDGLTDSVEFTVLPPTIDYIEITDVPDGTPLDNRTVPVGFTEWVNCSAYNTTADFIYTVNANWSIDGGTAFLLGGTPSISNGIHVNMTSDIVYLNVSYSIFNDSVKYTVSPPTVDYINITDTPGGSTLIGGSVIIDSIEWGNCSSYNYTSGYIGTVAANWTVEGGNASLLGPTPAVLNGIDVGNATGIVWLNASYDVFNFSVQYIVTGITVDYIEITDIPNGTELIGGTVSPGYWVIGNCSSYNYTVGFLGVVMADWSAEGGNSILLGSSPGSWNGIDVGTTLGTIWFNASYGGLTDTVEYYLDPPSEPQGLDIFSGKSYINITWVEPDTNGSAPITGYTIYKRNATGSEIAIPVGNNLFYNDTTVTNGEYYYYNVTASNSLGEGKRSEEISERAGAVPSAPQGLTASVEGTYIKLTWSAPATDGGLPIINYDIYRDINPLVEVDEPYNTIDNVLSFTDEAVTGGFTYYYKVRAVNIIGESSLSNEDGATAVSVPFPPRDPTALTGDPYVNLSWHPPLSDGNSPITNYRVYRNDSTGNMTFYMDVGNVFYYNDTNVINNITYKYKVRAVNTVGESPFSEEVSATPRPPPIPVNELPSITDTSLTEGQEISGTFVILGNASDSDGTVQNIQIKIDEDDWINVSVTYEDGIASWTYSLDTTQLSNGEHNIKFRAYDGEDHSGEINYTVKVNNPISPKEKSILEEGWFWGLIALIIIVLLLVLFWIIKMRKISEEEPWEEEEEELEEEEDEELEDEEELEEELEGEASEEEIEGEDDLDLDDDELKPEIEEEEKSEPKDMDE